MATKKTKLIGEEIVTVLLSGNYRIHIPQPNALKGFRVLFQAPGQIGILTNDTYLVSDDHISLLKKAGVSFEVVKQ